MSIVTYIHTEANCESTLCFSIKIEQTAHSLLGRVVIRVSAENSQSTFASVGPHVVSMITRAVGTLTGARVGHVGAVGDTDDVGDVGETDGATVGTSVGEVGGIVPFEPEMQSGSS